MSNNPTLEPRHTLEEYREAILGLLPQGPAWDSERETPEGDVYRLLSAYAQEFSRLGDRIRALVDEANPLSTAEMMEDWERFLSISPPSGSTLADRRLAVYSALMGNRMRSEPPIVSVARSYGAVVRLEDSRDIPVWTFERGHNPVGARLYNLNYRHLLVAHVLNASVQDLAFEAALRKVALAHLTVRFVYEGGTP